MDNGFSPSDIALMSDRSNDGWSGMIWLFAILALMGGGFGGFGGGYRPQYATQDFVQNGFNFNDLQDQNRDISNLITTGTAQSVAATNQVFHDIVGYVGDKYIELQRDVAGLAVGQANLLAKENECCCQTLRAIDGVNYNGAMNTARAYGMQNDVDFFFSLAKDFIEDPDAKPLKVEKYFLSE